MPVHDKLKLKVYLFCFCYNFGFIQYDIYIQVIGNAQKDVMELLKKLPCVSKYGALLGRWNIFLSIYVKDQGELDKVLTKIINTFSEDIKDFKKLQLIKNLTSNQFQKMPGISTIQVIAILGYFFSVYDVHKHICLVSKNRLKKDKQNISS